MVLFGADLLKGHDGGSLRNVIWPGGLILKCGSYAVCGFELFLWLLISGATVENEANHELIVVVIFNEINLSEPSRWWRRVHHFHKVNSK